MQRLYAAAPRFMFAGMLIRSRCSTGSRIKGVALDADEIRDLLWVVDRIASGGPSWPPRLRRWPELAGD